MERSYFITVALGFSSISPFRHFAISPFRHFAISCFKHAPLGNLGNAYKSLGDYRKAIECNKKDMKIATDIRDRAAEGRTYGSLGNAYDSLGVLSSPGQFIRPSSFFIS